MSRLQLGQDQGRALLIEPRDLAAIHQTVLAQPGAIGQARLGARHGQIALTQQVLGEDAVNRIKTDQRGEAVPVSPRRMQMGLLKDGFEKCGRLMRRDEVDKRAGH